MKIQLCCGRNKKPGFVNVDLFDYGQEKIADINKGLPFKENSAEYILIESGIEHLDDPIFFLQECERVLQWRGILEIVTDHYKWPSAYMVQHKHFFSWKSFHELFQEFIPVKKLAVIENRLVFTKRPNPWIELIPNLSPNWWERLLPCIALRVKIQKVRK